ncbi:type III secretion system export apparatus subunit SctS [Luteimonas mephitis]|jgi:type III secretion HrpO family protein|uniref:type III secretion system export apparatus subunit SctS n=1 Tax=Luteimonas mephitis TaxID=83615 RepID=UPI0004161940|nr:type III secretion system export apparatus subunit SctS [Luteimonas mephitis]
MNEVIELTKQALWLTLILSGPPVGAAALVGLLVAFLQAATQLQEQTFAYALKFLAIVVTLFITAALIGGTLYTFADRIFVDFPGLVRH